MVITRSDCYLEVDFAMSAGRMTLFVEVDEGMFGYGCGVELPRVLSEKEQAGLCKALEKLPLEGLTSVVQDMGKGIFPPGTGVR